MQTNNFNLIFKLIITFFGYDIVLINLQKPKIQRIYRDENNIYLKI